MPRENYRSDRHAALDAVYPPDKRYCACKQGRRQDCRCAYREDEPMPWSRIRFGLLIAFLSYFACFYFGIFPTP
jgi:hypothetical protein